MVPQLVRTKLLNILKAIQTMSGQDCPELTGSTCPVCDLPDFTSKIWPVAAGMLGVEIGCDIPCEVNIFVEKQTNKPLTIEQIVAFVTELANAPVPLEKSA